MSSSPPSLDTSSGDPPSDHGGSNASLDLNDVGLGEVGFMFDAHQPTVARRLAWTVAGRDKPISVLLRAIDDEPGALQSGHYLWPAAALLVDFLTGNLSSSPPPPTTIGAASPPVSPGAPQAPPSPSQLYAARRPPRSTLELGAGCGLASLAALQLWQRSLQCVVVTDHDPGVVERARDNYETTVQALLEQSTTDSDLNACINSLGSIPVCFEELPWGRADGCERVAALLAEHVCGLPPEATGRADLVLATDVIYEPGVVVPLFQTAMALGDCLLMAQSFAYDAQTENEIARMCRDLSLDHRILYSSHDGKQRIQEFVRR